MRAQTAPTAVVTESASSEDARPALRRSRVRPASASAPVVTESRVTEAIPAPAATDDAASDVPSADAFIAASRLFADSSEAPAEVSDAPETASEASSIEAGEHVTRRRGRFNVKRVTATTLSVGVVGAVMALTVEMAFPAAPAGNSTTRTVASSAGGDEAIQAFVAPSDVQNTDVSRTDGYQSVTAAEIAAETGINYSSDVFINDPTSPIQWPFTVGTGMSYGYGVRSGVMHEGVDFTPGDGAPIPAIADGTVRIATENGGGYGVTVYIDHVIDGQAVTSHYAHM